MTTIVPFAPGPTTPFEFSAQLDGAAYTVYLTWNLGGRWFINIYDGNSVLILCRALVGSPPYYDIDLVLGYFTSTLVYREATNNFEISP